MLSINDVVYFNIADYSCMKTLLKIGMLNKKLYKNYKNILVLRLKKYKNFGEDIFIVKYMIEKPNEIVIMLNPRIDCVDTLTEIVTLKENTNSLVINNLEKYLRTANISALSYLVKKNFLHQISNCLHTITDKNIALTRANQLNVTHRIDFCKNIYTSREGAARGYIDGTFDRISSLCNYIISNYEYGKWSTNETSDFILCATNKYVSTTSIINTYLEMYMDTDHESKIMFKELYVIVNKKFYKQFGNFDICFRYVSMLTEKPTKKSCSIL